MMFNNACSQAKRRQKVLIDKGFNGAFVRTYHGDTAKLKKEEPQQDMIIRCNIINSSLLETSQTLDHDRNTQ